jgi:uncharacterized protein
MAIDFVAQDVSSIADIAPAAWDRLFPNRLENYAYFRACEVAVPEGFQFAARTVYRGDELVAACPTFTSRYDVDLAEISGLDGLLRKLRMTTSFLKLNVNIQGFGSPTTEHCPIGVLPSLTNAERVRAINALLTRSDDSVGRHWNSFEIVKDVTPETMQWLQPIAVDLGFAIVPNLPTVRLNTDFTDETSYVKSLSKSMQTYIRARIKKSTDVDIEIRNDSSNLGPELHRLYLMQQVKAATDSGIFDGVSPLFWDTLSDTPDVDSVFILHRLDGDLIGFSMGVVRGETCNIKYIGLQQPIARDKHLYFLNWMAVVRFCIGRGVKVLDVGQNSYNVKTRLGCKLRHSYILLRHPKRSLNTVVRHAGRVLAFDRMDAELKALGEKAVYLDLPEPAHDPVGRPVVDA